MLVTYAQAIDHLRQRGVLDDPEDADVTLKLAQAEAFVLHHLELAAEAIPAEGTTLPIVQAAILKVLGNLYRFRGDDDTANPPIAPVSPDVAAMLSPLREPKFA